MKIFGIIIPLAFLSASYSVSGASAGDPFQNGVCAVARKLGICPSYPHPCSYESFENKIYGPFRGMFSFIINSVNTAHLFSIPLLLY